MREYPIPLIELKEAIKRKRYDNLYVSCKIENKGLKHFITAKSNVTNAKEFWFYDEKTGKYEIIGE